MMTFITSGHYYACHSKFAMKTWPHQWLPRMKGSELRLRMAVHPSGDNPVVADLLVYWSGNISSFTHSALNILERQAGVKP